MLSYDISFGLTQYAQEKKKKKKIPWGIGSKSISQKLGEDVANFDKFKAGKKKM
jgi:hypothetical protein